MMTLLAQSAAESAGNDVYLLLGFGLAAVALVLLVVELFVPSGGIIGLLCAVAAIGSIVAFFQYDTTVGVAALLAYLVLGPIVVVALFKFWLSSPLAKRMILGGRGDAPTATSEESQFASEQARMERLAELTQLIGAEGVAATALRPVGTIVIDGRRIDAMAQTGVIEPDTPVVVCDVYDNQIKVRPA